ncbi:4-hydroxybenzoyl-CoA reductase subunit alpha [Pelotomaculum sp. FP]|uniref:xanthine dehydrogenase family protein molybdopterin-binding subunit n=1 Tax=Pelotomaculum sp. FP TaxID=261474 RepID=UPI00106611D7|nr:xanthine dehydrogenase family protein molybdopterin-binding subunit [Pelotomaculum sp. FP]TEB18038.1 4-hydroxybenzoyl-CoA reductase subunit alpha [Pelotomaculum sp. FP]
MSEYSVVGKSVPRKDAYEKATGKAIFTADIKPKGMLYGKILGSPYAHARIKKIDASEALKLPGVIGVITGEDCPEERTAGYIHDRHVLAKKTVRYVGDPVAVVAAVSNAVADEALKLVKVEYEELPAVFDPEEARSKECKVVVHEELPNYQHIEFQGVWSSLDPERPNQFIHRKIIHGDIEKGFAEADFIFEGRYSLPRASHCCLEPHVALAVPEADGSLTLYGSEQGGMYHRYEMCEVLGLETSKMRFVSPHLGGGFGGKVGIIVCPIAGLAALKLKRPVRIEMSREDVFVSGNPRSPGIVLLKDGYKKDGTLVARYIEEIVDSGAYSTHTTVLVSAGVYGATGTYRCPHMRIDAYGVYTNLSPTGPYRSLGSEILTFAVESLMDKAADELGISRVEIRRKNLLVDGDIDPIGQVTYNNGTMACLDKAVEYLKLDEPKRAPEGPWVFGRGISTGNKFTAYWNTGTVALCHVYDDGVIEIRTMHCEMGQGAVTVLAQIAAEEFQTSYDKIKIVNGDSAVCGYDEGTYCSRGTFINGNAVRLACQDAKKQVFNVASGIMGVPDDKLETRDGKVYEIGNPDNSIYFYQLFEYGGYLLEGGVIIGKDTFVMTFEEDDRETGQSKDLITFYSYGALGFEVAVNTETGEVKILKAGGWYDMGYPLNPKLVELQLEGAFVMGIGQALYEEVKFNDQGKVINPNFLDYRIPTMLDAPKNEALVSGFAATPHKNGPYGAKGIGEVALVPVMPGISNAIRDALGIEIKQIPLTRERVLNAIKEKAEKEQIM